MPSTLPSPSSSRNGASATQELVQRAVAGDRRALARLLSRIEAGDTEAEALALSAHADHAHLIGITGAPGTGKSTLVARLAEALRQRGDEVAIVAVDPSSPFTGGALLGDRIRMGSLSGDPGAFVRSMASRGAGGGLAEQTAASAAVLASVGFDAVFVETVGVGQSELEIAAEAQTTVVVTAPGLGDEVQALKAGILEVADVLVVNKADREGADRLAAELAFARETVLPHVSQEEPWRPPVVRTVAATGEGVPELLDALAAHRAWLERSGAGRERARMLAERHLLRRAAAVALQRAAAEARASGLLDDLVEQVAAHHMPIGLAVSRLLGTDRPCVAPADSPAALGADGGARVVGRRRR